MLARYLQAATAGSKAKPSFVSQSINRSNGNSITVTAPTGIQDGFLIIAFGIHAATSQVVTPPTGFNVQYCDGVTDNTVFFATKIASGETGNYIWSYSTSGTNTVSMLVYKDATTLNTVGTIARAASGATSTASSITPTYSGTLIAAFAAENALSVNTDVSGMTNRSSYTALTPSVRVYDLDNQGASSTGSKTLIWSANSTPTAAILFQITNESSVAPTLVATASTQNSATGSSLVINKPTGTLEGDLMIAVNVSSGGYTWTGDTGWTEVADSNAIPGLRIAYKVAGASEGSSYTFTASSGLSTLSGSILTYRGAAYDTINASFTTATNPMVLPSVSATESQSILIAAGARSSTLVTLGTPTSMNALVTDNNGTTPSYIVCDQQIAKGPSGTRSMSTGSTTNVGGIMLSIKPTRTPS